jgi:hypothetical protein
MIQKMRENIPLILGAITLMGALGSGLQQLNVVITSIQTVDERIFHLEDQFQRLSEDTMVASDIAVLYEKIYALEQQTWNAQYLEDRVLILEENYGDLQEKLYDLEYLEERIIYLESNQYNDDGNGIEEWDFDNLKDRVLILETQWNDKWWKFDNYDDRLDYLESDVFGW